MKLTRITHNGVACAVLSGTEPVLTDAQAMLDALMTAAYECGTKNLVVDKRQLTPDFFILSTGVAGEMLQKLVNYGGRIDIYGDFSRYTSKPLHDFIYESNRGGTVFFATSQEEAIALLTNAQAKGL